MLIPGTYKLVHDVANPKPDRRVNQSRTESWHGWVTWPAGLVFVVEEYALREEEAPVRRVFARGGFSHFALIQGDPGFSALEPALARIEESPSDYLKRTERGSVSSIALAILDRALTTEQVRRIISQLEEEDEQR